VIAISEEQQALDDIAGTTPIYSNLVPIKDELKKHVQHMASICLNVDDVKNLPDPLVYYSKGNYGGDYLPVFSRMSASIFAACLTSGDVERTNSTAGNIITPHRCRLNPNRVRDMVFLRGVFAEEEEEISSRQKKARLSFNNFVIHMGQSCFESIKTGLESYDFLTQLDSLCSWVVEMDTDEESDEDGDEIEE